MAKDEDALASRLFASSPEQWNFKRMAAQPLDTRAAGTQAGGARSFEYYGLNGIEIRRPAAFSFARPPNEKRSPYWPDFERFKEGSAIAPDEKTITDWLQDGAVALNGIKGMDTNVFLNTELPSWKKLSVMKGERAFWMVGQIGPGWGTVEIPSIFRNIVRHILSVYKAQPVREIDRLDPADTNAGAPLYYKGPAAKVVSRACLCFRNDKPDLGRTASFGEMVASAQGLPPEAAYAFATATRFGAKYKLEDVLQLTPVGWAVWGQAAGDSPRKRLVFMAPTVMNEAMGDLYAWMKSARMSISGLWHAGPADLLPFMSLPFHYESDISGFDVSVVPELQLLVAEEIIRAMPELRDAVEWWRYAETRGLLGPSWSLYPDMCSLVTAAGGTRSGEKITSEMGTFYALAATLYAEHLQGYDYRDWPRRPGGDAWQLHLGDDVRASFSKPISAEGWAEAYAQVGLKSELIEGDGFLSRHVSPEGGNAPIAGRIVQQTMANEKENVSEAAEGIAMLGFIARTAGAERLPDYALKYAWQCIRHANFIKKLGTTSLLETRETLRRSPEATATIAQALADSAGQSWIAEVRRDAEYSLSAFTTWQLIRDRPEVIKATGDSTADQRFVETCVREVRTWSEPKRFELVTKSYELLKDGGSPDDLTAFITKTCLPKED